MAHRQLPRLCWSKWRRIPRCSCGSTASSNTRTRPQENFGREIMELFTPRHRQLHRAGRLRRGARVHRLEPGSSSATAPTTETSYYEFLYHAEPARHQREEVHLPDLPGRRHARFPARAAAQRRCRTALDLIDALARHPATAQRLARTALQVLRQRDVDAPDQAFVNDVAQRVPASNYSIKAMLQRLLLLGAVPERRQRVPALLLAGRVRGARDQGDRLDAASRSTARSRRSPTWGSSCTSRPT